MIQGDKINSLQDCVRISKFYFESNKIICHLPLQLLEDVQLTKFTKNVVLPVSRLVLIQNTAAPATVHMVASAQKVNEYRKYATILLLIYVSYYLFEVCILHTEPINFLKRI